MSVRSRILPLIGAALVAALAGCATSAPASTSIADARTIFASVSCSIDTTLDTYVGQLYTDVPRIHRYASSTRDALTADARALAEEHWPASIAIEVSRLRGALQSYAVELDAISRAAAATNPPQLNQSFRSMYTRIRTWFDLDPDSVCHQGALERRVSDGTARADYVGAVCSTQLPLQVYYGAARTDPARVRANAESARDALLRAARDLAGDDWPAPVREAVEIIRDNRFAYSAAFDVIASSGIYDDVALTYYDTRDRAVFDRVSRWFGVNWGVDCLP